MASRHRAAQSGRRDGGDAQRRKEEEREGGVGRGELRKVCDTRGERRRDNPWARWKSSQGAALGPAGAEAEAGMPCRTGGSFGGRFMADSNRTSKSVLWHAFCVAGRALYPSVVRHAPSPRTANKLSYTAVSRVVLAVLKLYVGRQVAAVEYRNRGVVYSNRCTDISRKPQRYGIRVVRVQLS